MAILIFVAVGVLVAASGGSRPLLMLAALAALPFAYAARKLLALSAEELLSRDPRPPVLYLRSFGVDRDELGGRVGRAVGGHIDYRSEEEALSTVLGRIGPVIAIGRPGEVLPTLGAARLYVGDDEWQRTVAEISDRAALTVLRLGDTDGFWWEVRRAAESLEPPRVLLYVPGEVRAERERAYQAFRERAAPLFGHELPSSLGSARFIWFGDGWRPMLLDERGLGFRRWLTLQASVDGSAQRVHAPLLAPLFVAHGVRTPGARGSILGWAVIGAIGCIPIVLLYVAILLLVRSLAS